jgi:hypothetical protein
MQKRSIEKIKKKYGANCFKKWGSPASGGGSPILMSYKLHKPIKGYKVSHT